MRFMQCRLCHHYFTVSAREKVKKFLVLIAGALEKDENKTLSGVYRTEARLHSLAHTGRPYAVAHIRPLSLSHDVTHDGFILTSLHHLSPYNFNGHQLAPTSRRIYIYTA